MNQSPFHSVLGTNYVPTEQECETISEILVALEKELIELRSEIVEQEATPQNLQERYRDLQGNIHAHRALISPFRRIPDDILREISLHCLPHNRNPATCAAEPPILLTHVCGRWRQVAFSTPRLWSSLHISNYLDEFQIRETKIRSRNEGTLRWIARAGDIPFSLSFPARQRNLTPERRVRRNADLRRLLSILSPIFPRCKNVDIFLEGLESELSGIVALRAEGGQKLFRSLEQLSIRLSIHKSNLLTSEQHMRKVSRLLRELELSSSKRLRKLGLYLDEYTQLHSESLRLNDLFPCGQLEVLDLQGNLFFYEGARLPLNLLPSILQACPKLVIFKANIGRPQRRYPPVSTSRIPLARLKELSLFLPDGESWYDLCLDILARCDWPGLTSLYLRTFNSRCADMSLFSSFTDRFSIPLTSLRLSSFGIYIQSLNDLVFALPALVQLHLEHPALSGSRYGVRRYDDSDEEETPYSLGNVIAHLTPDPDGTPHALPRLRFLKWELNTGFSDMALANLLQQRSTSPYSPVPMEQVHIRFGRDMQEDIIPICSNLIEAGLDLRLRYTPEFEFDTSRETMYRYKGHTLPLERDYRTLGWS